MESGFGKQTLFFFLLLLGIVISVGATTRNLIIPKAATNNTQFIKTSCTATTYPKLCFTSLSPHANKIQTNQELLTKTAIDVALWSTETTAGAVEKLRKGGRLSPREVGAVTDCVEELRDSMDELKRSVSEMKKMMKLKGADLKMTISNLQTWISAALTDENTCTDGFDGNSMDDDDDVKAFVRQHVLKIAHLTSNALALVNAFADILA